ncbi:MULTISPECIES: hypothetical protein [unclassified Bradyrhizobium]|uniref:hypothetical protein n=1 Tax=unclassified Bradyrhizobium TaxID=2631580 RepID=UPI0024E0E33F|nr:MULTISPECIES: hypothetical protein [unclassified Bradyrhizobium]
MPFIFDQTEIEWPEDDSEPPAPRVKDFVYLPSPEFTGIKEPVRFSPDPPAEVAEPGPPAASEPIATAAPARRSLLDRLFRRAPRSESPQPDRSTLEERRRRDQLERDRRRQLLLSTMVPALRAAGAKRAYCRYDGGNDEGFSWLDHYVGDNGDRLDLDLLAVRLWDAGLHGQLRAAGYGSHLTETLKKPQVLELKNFLSSWLTDEWATLLLGRGFGTGEYTMYGAFWVDLETCTISDDRNADPVVENITIAD